MGGTNIYWYKVSARWLVIGGLSYKKVSQLLQRNTNVPFTEIKVVKVKHVDGMSKQILGFKEFVALFAISE